MSFSKIIKLFLVDEGDPNGRIIAELSQWTGKAYKIPRIRIRDSNDRPELYQSGVYFLFGKNENGDDKVYIGEAEDVLSRLKQHLGAEEKEFWNETIIFISKDENLNKAHVKFLEHHLYQLALKSGRYQLANGNIPNQPAISEMERAEMEEFLSNIRLLVNTFGHKVFEDRREASLIRGKKKETFFIKGARNAEGQGEPTAEGFVVFKGSRASLDTTKGASPSYAKYREKLIDIGVMENKGDYYEFLRDELFSSPSAAAVVILGRSANGLTEWKTSKGQTLKGYEESEE